jgi:outer membrane receptor protein involved in Fe transport
MRFFQVLASGSCLVGMSAATLSWAASPAGAEGPIEEVVVRAGLLRDQALQQVPASVTVLNADTLNNGGQQHFQDVLAQVPNLNWAGGTSRPRFFQVRGIGELEQYQGAPNPSVGFLIDDVDFSGIGMAATLYDVSQVEVLRGPQGTRLGANALAGMIAVRSADPSMTPGFSIDASGADYDTGSVGLIATGPVESLRSAWRLSVQKFKSDGFRDDAFLGRKDTNDRDELSARFKWRVEISPDSRLDFTLLHADIDDGYDGWSIDNSWQSQADRPGVDTQKATAASARFTSNVRDAGTLTVIGAFADSRSVNSFDGDWGNADLWAPYTYDYFSWSSRDRHTGSLEARFASNEAVNPGEVSWLIGAYGQRLHETGHDTSVGEYADPFDPSFDGTLDEFLGSRYRADTTAVFGQLDGVITSKLRWSVGLRGERREATYEDAGFWQATDRVTDLSSSDSMMGGQVSATYALTSALTTYASVSRGYKAGGFNLGAVPADRLRFNPEYLWNYEYGFKYATPDRRFYADLSAFYSRRRDVQIRTGEQLVAGDPNSYVFFTDNASRGYNYGVESSLRWQLTEQWQVDGSLGLLRTRYQDYDQGGSMLPDREQPHAPKYQAALNASWHHPTGWTGRVGLTALDKFYFDVPPNDTQSHAYVLTNVQFGYETARWSALLWGRNVLNREYAVRGFFFGNEPPNFENELYIQRGDPRQVGVSFHYSFR